MLALLGIAAILYFISSGRAAENTALLTSGTVEAEAITLASEPSGSIAEMRAAEGQSITAGEMIFRLDESLLQSQRQRAVAALDDLTVNAAAGRGQAARAVAVANRAVRDAAYMLDNYTVSSLQKDLAPAEGLALTKKMLDEARLAFEPYRSLSQSNERLCRFFSRAAIPGNRGSDCRPG